MTDEEREEQAILLEQSRDEIRCTDVRVKWINSIDVAGFCLDAILESAAYAWTDGPES